MRLLSVRLIVSLIVGITLVSFGFSYYEVLGEKRTLRSDLERRAEMLGESLASNVERSWNAEDKERSDRELQRLVQRFENREHLMGVVIYDQQGALVATTPELAKTLTVSPQVVTEAIAHNHSDSAFLKLGKVPAHILALPIRRKDEVLGGLAVVHDVSYIRAQSLLVWRQSFFRVLVQVFLIVLITLLIVRWSITGPIARAALWMRALRTGKISFQEVPDLAMFRPLAREVATMAASLSHARSAAENEARLRDAGESLWTADRLSVQLRTRLEDSHLFVVSNREPYMHWRDGKTINVVVPPSGLVTALEPVLNACDGTWIAHGNGNADTEVVDA
ncbi:MAG: trehalose-6-phosphate synthase, partial [Terriglobales bacterium]